MSERDARQFVIRVLDVAQGTGALLQVDDQPPRWLSANDSLAVDVPVRWTAFDDYEVGELHYGLIDAESEDPSPDSNSRRRRLIDELASESERRTSSASKAEAKPDLGHDDGRAPIAAGWGRARSTVWACPRCEQRHVLTGDAWLDCVCGARYRFVYGDEPEADAPERWSGWSDEELDRLGQMLGDGGHELADLQAERRRRHAEAQHCCVHDWDVIEYGGAPVAMVCADCGAKRKVVDE